MPKKPTAPKTTTSQGLPFAIRLEPDPDTDEPPEFGCFSRKWDQEEALDQLMDDLDSGRINDKQALLHAQKLLAQSPGNLEVQNYLANRCGHSKFATKPPRSGPNPSSRLAPSCPKAT